MDLKIDTPPSGPRPSGDPTIGLALGGGAARGIAHIPVLEAFDELGIKPAIIAGTSIGAVMGAGYASGMTGSDMREYVRQLFERRGRLARKLMARWPEFRNLWSPFSLSVINPESFFDIVLPDSVAADFSRLKIPLKVVAADLHSLSQVILEKGELLPAVAASCAIPALFKPVVIGGHVLVDGGAVNPTPFDILRKHVDITVAIDVTSAPTIVDREVPSTFDTIVLATQIVLHALTLEKLRIAQPDVYIRPEVGAFRPLEFFRVNEILLAGEEAKDELKRKLDRIFSAAAA